MDDADDAEILRRRVAGESLDAIAAAVGRSKSVVHDRIRGPLADAIAAETGGARSGEKWSEDEDVELIGIIARGGTVHEAARRLGRPVEGTRYRCKTVLREQISAAKVASAKARRARVAAAAQTDEGSAPASAAPCVASAPAEPVAAGPAEKPAPVSRPVAEAPSPVTPKCVSAVSPVAGVKAEDMTPALVLAHLGWLYGETPDRDQVQGDLELVELLLTTGSAAQVAQEFDWPKDQVLSRWKAVRGCDGVTLDLQRYMLDVLRDMLREGVAA